MKCQCCHRVVKKGLDERYCSAACKEEAELMIDFMRDTMAEEDSAN